MHNSLKTIKTLLYSYSALHVSGTSYRGGSRAVFVVGPADRPDHEHSTTVTTIRR
jgi:hypothetical protein